MAAQEIYLDANASERLRPEARAALLACLDGGAANPASVHEAGRRSRAALESARLRIAGRIGLALGRGGGRVVFTSGGTEANTLALSAHRQGDAAPLRIILGATEHPALRAAAPSAGICPVGADGRADPETLDRMLAGGGPALVALMVANNETGVLHPLDALSAVARAHGALLHLDAVQAAGRLGLDHAFARWGAASLALSSHKLGAPAGAGALLLGPGIDIVPIQPGGGQEGGLRGGTQALAAIVAMDAALATCDPGRAAALALLRDRIEAAAREAGAVICGGAAPRLPNTSCIALPGRPAQTQLIALDLAGIRVSAGSACSSGKLGPSPVLAAMGLGALAGEAIRVSLPWDVTEAQVDAFIAAWQAMAARRPATQPALSPVGAG